MPGKKTNNKHSYGARETWLKNKKQDRPKQAFVNGQWVKADLYIVDLSAIETRVVESLST